MNNLVVLVQSFSHVWLFPTPRTAVDQASLSFTISWILLKPTSNESVMPSSHPLLPPYPLALNLFQHECLFQWVSCSHQVAKVLDEQPSPKLSNCFIWLTSLWVKWVIVLIWAISLILCWPLSHLWSAGVDCSRRPLPVSSDWQTAWSWGWGLSCAGFSLTPVTSHPSVS